MWSYQEYQWIKKTKDELQQNTVWSTTLQSTFFFFIFNIHYVYTIHVKNMSMIKPGTKRH